MKQFALLVLSLASGAAKAAPETLTILSGGPGDDRGWRRCFEKG
mgnify:CR=1 FL=1